MRPSFGRVKMFRKSGAYLYLAARLVEDDRFPFKDGEVVKVELDSENKRIVVSTPEWWELLDWDKMPKAYEKLPREIKEAIQRSGVTVHGPAEVGAARPGTAKRPRRREPQ